MEGNAKCGKPQKPHLPQGLLTSTFPLIPFLDLFLHQGPKGLGLALIGKVQARLAVLHMPQGQQPSRLPSPTIPTSSP